MANTDAPPRLLHFHIYKNGGSTLDWILKQNFPNSFSEIHGSADKSTIIESDIESILDSHSATAAFSSHHFRLPLVHLRNVYPLLMLRHPLDRVPSIYEQERRMGHVGVDRGFQYWIEDCLDHRPYMLCDTQVSFFARGGVYYEPPTEWDLQHAKTMVDEIDFVGVVSDYDLSMVLLESRLRLWWPSFDARYFPQNRSMRDPALDARLRWLRDSIPASVFGRLELNNHYDIALFEHARENLELRTSAVPDLDMLLEDFSTRCSALR